MAWRGIIGKSFKTPDDFAAYVDTVQFGNWRPRFLVCHNTSAPDLTTYAKWQSRGSPSDEQWLKNLEGYYRDQMKWSAGPHLFVTPLSICVFSPLDGPGTHTPSWNSISWGVETVGEYETESFEGAVQSNLVAALGILHLKSGLSPLPYLLGGHGLHFHKEDVRTTHRSCPGKNMVKVDLVSRVQAYIVNKSMGDHHPILLPQNIGYDEPTADPILKLGSQGDAVLAMQQLLGKSGINLHLDGKFGSATRSALIEFQRAHNLDPDGACGPVTWAALRPR